LFSWITLSLLSAVVLGLYDIAKKASLKGNAVPVVLLLNVLTAAALWSIPIALSLLVPSESGGWWTQLTGLSRWTHVLLFTKSMMVGASWILAFFALKHLPISVGSPIRATSPLWTILIAVSLMGERLSLYQWLGVTVILIAFFRFSRVGSQEGIHFGRDRWVNAMIGATLLGSCCALYDKYLLQTVSLSPVVVQAWFSIYLVPVMLPLAVRWYARERASAPFQWRWTIPLIAILLLISDFTYFTAITYEGALISVISPLRRSSIIIAFLFGILQLQELNWRPKAVCVAGLLVGLYLLSVA
jgi:bacterial/archaeal transporter family protein